MPYIDGVSDFFRTAGRNFVIVVDDSEPLLHPKFCASGGEPRAPGGAGEAPIFCFRGGKFALAPVNCNLDWSRR